MSMHEFEDLVEASIRILDASPRAYELDLRTLFGRLYEFQASWDTGFTHFRVMDILLKHRFAYRFDLNQHPDYFTYQTYFDSLNKFSFIYQNPTKAWDKVENPVVAYYKPPYLYCDAGSWLWQSFVGKGLLVGRDAEELNKAISLLQVVREVVAEAEKQQASDTISLWYWLLSVHLYTFWPDKELDNLGSSQPLKETLEIWRRAGAPSEINPFRSYLSDLYNRLPEKIENYPNFLRQLREEANNPDL